MPIDKPVATLTIRNGRLTTPRSRKALAAWLRKEAKHIERCAKDYAPRVTCRYIAG